MLRGSICLWGQAFYTQSCEGSLLNFGFAYNSEGISVPARLEMEISYRFIRTSKIREPSSSHLRTNQFLLESNYTQSCEGCLLNFGFAYNSEGVSVPAKLKMEISYKFIRRSAEKCCRIAGLRIILRGISVPTALFIRCYKIRVPHFSRLRIK